METFITRYGRALAGRQQLTMALLVALIVPPMIRLLDGDDVWSRRTLYAMPISFLAVLLSVAFVYAGRRDESSRTALALKLPPNSDDPV